MKYNSIRVFLETMCEYNNVKINQVFTAENGQKLSIHCLTGTSTFEIQNSATKEVIQIESVEKTADYVMTFLAAYDLSKNS